jgi:hypothetical protein
MRGIPVTLVDGTVVDSYSQEWLLETGARATEAYAILDMADWKHGVWLAVSRLGGGEEQERRLTAAVLGMVRNTLPEQATSIANMVYRESRAEALRVFTIRWGETLGAELKQTTINIFEARKAANAAVAS